MTLRRHLRVLEAHSGVQLTQGNHQQQWPVAYLPKVNPSYLLELQKQQKMWKMWTKYVAVKAKLYGISPLGRQGTRNATVREARGLASSDRWRGSF